MILDLRNISDPRPYLHKRKLQCLGMNQDQILAELILISPTSKEYILAETITYAEATEIIQSVIDVTYDAMTSFGIETNLYSRTTDRLRHALARQLRMELV